MNMDRTWRRIAFVSTAIAGFGGVTGEGVVACDDVRNSATCFSMVAMREGSCSASFSRSDCNWSRFKPASRLSRASCASLFIRLCMILLDPPLVLPGTRTPLYAFSVWLYLMALFYHSWLDLLAVLFFLLFISYPVTDKE